MGNIIDEENADLQSYGGGLMDMTGYTSFSDAFNAARNQWGEYSGGSGGGGQFTYGDNEYSTNWAEENQLNPEQQKLLFKQQYVAQGQGEGKSDLQIEGETDLNNQNINSDDPNNGEDEPPPPDWKGMAKDFGKSLMGIGSGMADNSYNYQGFNTPRKKNPWGTGL